MQKIPLIDIRRASPLTLLEGRMEEARQLIALSRRSFGLLGHAASYAALPTGDWFAKRWLSRTGNPYRGEIDAFAARLGVKGVHALNLVYEFGCTSGVYATGHGPRLLRVLDWPFPGLGAHTVVAHQRGPAGDFHNVTWPGTSGVFSALAQGRFAVALNQAPPHAQACKRRLSRLGQEPAPGMESKGTAACASAAQGLRDRHQL